MRKFAYLVLALIITSSVSACTGAGGKNDLRVKCPACGYEFDVETKG